MKKATKIILIVTAILVIAAIITAIVFLNLNKSKEAIESVMFKTKMEEKGLTIMDASSQFLSVPEIGQVYLALEKNNNYKIEFYEFSNVDYAISFYNTNKNTFELTKGNASAETSVDLNNYAKYTLSSNGKYMVVSRIEDTVIYSSVDDQYRDVIKEILKEIGY